MLIRNVNRQGVKHRSIVCRGTPVIPLFFFLLVFLFCGTTDDECSTLNIIFATYEKVSEKTINYGKFEVFFKKNIIEDDKKSMSNGAF